MADKKIIVFTAPWCVPCRSYKPVVVEFVRLQSDIDVTFIDASTNATSSDEHKVGGVPTTIYIVDDKEVDRKVGAISMKELMDMVK